MKNHQHRHHSKKISKRHQEFLKSRENGFDLRFGQATQSKQNLLTEYNALHDQNMRHYFENKNTQLHLWRTGQIDRAGKVVDLEKNKSKLCIIEKEFQRAQDKEEKLMREEALLAKQVQQQRIEELIQARREEKIMLIKEDRKIQQEIAKVAKAVVAINGQQNNK